VSVKWVTVARTVECTTRRSLLPNVQVDVTVEVHVNLVNAFAIQDLVDQIVKIVPVMNVQKVKV
jgi:hypothetical protein